MWRNSGSETDDGELTFNGDGLWLRAKESCIKQQADLKSLDAGLGHIWSPESRQPDLAPQKKSMNSYELDDLRWLEMTWDDLSPVRKDLKWYNIFVKHC